MLKMLSLTIGPEKLAFPFETIRPAMNSSKFKSFCFLQKYLKMVNPKLYEVVRNQLPENSILNLFKWQN